MTELFQNVLTASFHGSIVILAVILLRLLLKKTPKKFLCFLWLLAGIRLLMPFEIQSVLSLQPDVDTIRETYRLEEIREEVPAADLPIFQPEAEVLPQQPVQDAVASVMPEAPQIMEPVNSEPLPEEPQILLTMDAIAANIWLAVAFGFLLYTIGSYIRLKLQVREAIRIHGNVWECDRIETAFILGFIRPQIYLPMGMSRNNRRHILAHERTHLEKGDHWIKMIGFIALALHWFNPLVWVAYILLCKDIEMACDERVVQFMELEERKSYSAALVNCSTNHAHFAACPVAFGEVSVKNRVMTVLNYKKPSFWISLAGVIAIAFVAVCLVTSPTEKAEEPVPAATEETQPPREVVEVGTVDELLSAIGPEREIVLEPNSYNLSEASTYGSEPDNEYYYWLPVSDGYELVLSNVEDLTIRGSGMHVTLIETDPRFADVLAMENCHRVELEGITLGHTRLRGECGGGVISLRQSSDIDLHQLGLYGCGMVGLETDTAAHVTLTDSDIYDCSNSAASLNSSQDIIISGCRLYNIGDEQYGGYTYINAWGCRDVMVENNELSDSDLNCLLASYDSEVTLKNNSISGNRFTGGALSMQCNADTVLDVVLDNNKFTDNAIRKWYEFVIDGYVAKDGKGKELTEEVLTKTYGVEQDKAAQPQQPQLQIHVATVDEFIAAIGPDKEIILDGALYDLSTATGYGTSKGDYYYWEDVFDGPGLVIQNVSNMTIRSNDDNLNRHTISAIPRYADVLAFKSCSNITVSGFTAGHTKEPGSCAGGVLEFRDSDFITVENCGLFGCGILGVQTQSCSNVTVRNSEIYECSQGGIQMWDTYDIVVENTAFRDIGGRYIMQFSTCKNVEIDGQTVIGNVLDHHYISTPEQDALNALESLVLNFIQYFLNNDAENLETLLADSYTGEVTVWSEGDDIADANIPDVSKEDLDGIKEDGMCLFSVTVRRWNSAVSDWEEGEWKLTYTVIEENGEFKVNDYSLRKTQ